jgi:hypothetical protein
VEEKDYWIDDPEYDPEAHVKLAYLEFCRMIGRYKDTLGVDL